MSLKRTILFAVVVVVLAIAGWLAYGIFAYRQAVEAAGGFPYQAGLTQTVITPCVLTPASVCVGHPLCSSVPGACADFSGVTGTPAGGNGNQVLLRNEVIGQIGLVPGASYIGGGTSPVFMHASASIGGWSYALSERGNGLFEYIIAGFFTK